ncbi:MAG TPA: transcription termination factor NusA [Candidatus Brocadiia bacterium]|nr:transcription termination factor NusA [Candidatus Brocadiia bacterium]
MRDGEQILRLVEALHKSKDIDRESIFEAVETALAHAAQKKYGSSREITITVDRQSGEVAATADGKAIDPSELGRIAAQTAKQVIMQRIRESERDSILSEYETKLGTLVSGVVRRMEGGAAVVTVDKTEAILPRGEQIPGEFYHPNDRIRAMIVDVRKVGTRARIVLSRTHQDLVLRLFETEVPEIADKVVQIMAIAREPGTHTKVAVISKDTRIDCVGACVGVRGTRIKNITGEMGGEKVDIVRWSDAPEMLIANALKPAEVYSIELIEEGDSKRALVTVPHDQLSRAIGKRGQNVRLASKLSKWDIDIVAAPQATPEGEAAAAGEQAASAAAPAVESPAEAPVAETAPAEAEQGGTDDAPKAEPVGGQPGGTPETGSAEQTEHDGREQGATDE